MISLTRIFSSRRDVNESTASARKRLAASMPGETGALASLRLAGLSL